MPGLSRDLGPPGKTPIPPLGQNGGQVREHAHWFEVLSGENTHLLAPHSERQRPPHGHPTVYTVAVTPNPPPVIRLMIWCYFLFPYYNSLSREGSCLPCSRFLHLMPGTLWVLLHVGGMEEQENSAGFVA